MFFTSSPSFRSTRVRLLALVLALIVPAGLVAEDQPAPKKQLSEKVYQEVQKMGALMTEQKWDELLRIIDGLLATADPLSYDTAFLSQFKVQALLGKQDYKNSIPPLETAINLSERFDYFGDRDLELIWLLAQLYTQDAAAEKNRETQRATYAKAYTTLKRWLDRTPKINPDAQYFVASILYNQAIDEQKVDKSKMEEAKKEAEKGLLLSIQPKEQFYTLLVAINQQLGDYPKSAEYLELLVKDFPKNKTYWQQLLNAYLNEGEAGYISAIVTLERAQKLGLLNDKQENFRLVGLHLNTQQYSQAAELFEAGLRNGNLESEQKNWELLATCYQQLHKEAKAIATLKEAEKLFPKAGNLDLLIANLYYITDHYPDALTYMKSAVSKGLEKTQQLQAYIYIAYLGLDLKKFDDAKMAAEKAVELDPNSKSAKDLLKAVTEAIQERDAQLAAPTVSR